MTDADRSGERHAIDPFVGNEGSTHGAGTEHQVQDARR